MTHFNDIRVEHPEPGIARIMFARAKSNNTFRPQGLAELCIAMDELSADDSVRVIILAADGKHFSAGADIQFLDQVTQMTPAQIKEQVYQHFQGAAKRLWYCPKPTIALVQGAAVSVGCELSLACDFRIAANDASFLEVWIKFGIMPPLGGTFLLPRIIGLGRAKEMVLRGKPMLAADALNAGLVSEVVAKDKLAERGLAMARELSALSSSAYTIVKEALHRGLDSSMDAEWTANLPNQALLLSSEDFHEGLNAAKEKRTALFK
ncbi:MAG: enoyl-CoA hydratase/isomerase family protein [Pseudomonadota bacterium]